MLLRILFLASAVAALATSASAQSGYITGTVTDVASGARISDVRIEAFRGAAATTVAQSATDANGQFRLSSLDAGEYRVVFTRIGYRQETRTVTVNPGSMALAIVAMTQAAVRFNPMVVTASRREETALAAPATVTVIDQQQIEERPALTVADHLKGVAGLDVSTGGIVQSNIVARGFNNAFSGALLTMQDGRFAAVPSLRVNIPNLFTATSEDIDHIEVVLGPAAALYGPNSANGVLAIFTKSPFDSKGTTIAVDAGEQSILRASVRHAGTYGSTIGYKISAQTLTGTDFEYHDPNEPPALYRPPSHGAPRQLTAVTRDFSVRQQVADIQLDVRPSTATEIIGSYGIARVGSALELTGANGTGQMKDWSYQHVQLRMKHNGFSAQLFENFSDAGNADSLDNRGTFLLQSGTAIVDRSRVLAAQAQQGFDLGTRQSFIGGIDYIFTNPRTANTIDGRNEDIDDVTEVGAYLHSTTHLSDKFDFVAALRGDHHSYMESTTISPRAALVFKASETQNFRVTYNRAFATPGTFSFFLDLVQRQLDPRLPYFAYALGNPHTGFQYRRDCADGVEHLCMKTYFGASPNAYVDAGGTPLYRAAVQFLVDHGLQQGLTAQYTPAFAAQAGTVAAAVVQAMQSFSPTNAQIGGNLRELNSSTLAFDPVAHRDDIAPLAPEIHNVLEAGYKAIVGDKLRISVDGWLDRRSNFTSPSANITPNVFLGRDATAAFLSAALTQALTPSLGAQNAATVAALTAPVIADSLRSVPIGTVVPTIALANSPDLRFSYYQIHEPLNVVGADLAVDYGIAPKWTVGATYSWVNKTEFTDVPGGNSQPLTLNAPNHKASLTVGYREEGFGWSGELRGRYTNTFPMNSGVYVGQVPVNAAVDANVAYRFRLGAHHLLWSATVNNVANNARPSFIGAPPIGRLAMMRVQLTF